MDGRRQIALYIHVPFCLRKCSYCDFYSVPLDERLADRFMAALLKEMSSRSGDVTGQGSPALLETIYYGGGTPTAIGAERLSHILISANQHFEIAEQPEITVEANPETVEPGEISWLRKLVANRLSLGVQSFDDAVLKSLERVHSAEKAREAFRAARDAGFDNINIDLMYGCPGQTQSSWESTLAEAIAGEPEHVCVYGLTVEDGTRLKEDIRAGRTEVPDQDEQAAMYELAIDALTGAGFEHYEISNFAVPGRRSRHNQVYWRNQEYLGLGPSAFSYIDGTRSGNTADLARYIEAISESGSATKSRERLTGKRRLGEAMILGLRMIEGVDLDDLERRFDLSPERAFEGELNRLVRLGLIESVDDRLRLTPKGLFLANQVFREFV
jgi:oxygen-independent coproporphyrinogen-3 oxidase